MNSTEAARLLHRAIAAIYRNMSRRGISHELPSFGVDYAISGVAELAGRTYVCLKDNERDTVAVYRVDTAGRLKRLRRWPAAVSANTRRLATIIIEEAAANLNRPQTGYVGASA